MSAFSTDEIEARVARTILMVLNREDAKDYLDQERDIMGNETGMPGNDELIAKWARALQRIRETLDKIADGGFPD